MKKLLLYIFLLGICTTYAQTIATQSFESSGDTWGTPTFSTPPCTVGNDIWDYTTVISSINPSDGSQFWGIRDLDGSCGGTGFETITLPDFAISSFTDVNFSFDYNAIGLDTNEDLKYELFYDNISQGEVIVVDGVGGNSDNTNGWLTETVSIPNSVNNIRVVFSARCNAGNDRAGFDNVRLVAGTGSLLPNDDCPSAITLTVGTDNTQNIVTGTNVGATSSGEFPSPNCGNYLGNDVWYTAQVPASGIITVETQNAGSSIDTAIEIYSGSCGSLSRILCNDDISYPSDLNSRISLTGLVNTTIYIRVWAYNNASSGDFNIVAFSTPSISNNDCADAQSLVVGSSNTENVVTGTNIGASSSGELPNPTCANYNGRDIWYTAQVPASGILVVETQNAGSSIDTAIAVYSGSCGALTQIDCDDDSGPGLYSTLQLTGLANTTVYIRVWSYNNASSGNFNIVAYSPDCLFSTTWNGSSWNNGQPNAFTSAILSGNYDSGAEGSFESCDCTINSSSTVNIRANNYFTVNNDLTVNGTLEVRHEGSLVMTDDNAAVLVSGTLNVHKTTTPFNQYDYTYWSSPTVNESIGSALSASVSNRIYSFDTTIYNELTTNGWTAVGGSTTMQAGTGYIAMGPVTGSFPQTQDVIFDGRVNNGVILKSIELSADNSKDYEDWNLIGNPYPSAISADLLLSDPLNTSVVGGTIYLWTHNTVRNTNSGEQDYNSNDYATYTFGTGGVAAVSGGPRPTGIVASGQGFFIDGASATNMTFNNSMRVNTGNDQFFRADQESIHKTTNKNDKIWLNLSNNKGAFSQLLIGFIEGATNGFDRSFDGLKFGGGWVTFYSLLEQQHLAIQGRSPLIENEEIPLGFNSFVDLGESLKIGIDHMEGRFNTSDFQVLLKDKLLNKTHDLLSEDYEFIMDEKGVFDDRFMLIINKNNVLSLEDVDITDQLLISSADDLLQVSTTRASLIKSFKAYDITGRLIIEKAPDADRFSVSTRHISKGSILLINAVLENNEMLIKKIFIQ